MKTEWELELCDELPMEFTMTNNSTYIQRKDIHEVEYHSLDGYQIFRGYECFSREITKSDYETITNQNLLIKEDYDGLQI